MERRERKEMTKLELWDFSQGGFDHEDKKTSTEWKFTIENNTLYFAFKYTDSDLDWKQNFFFLPRLQKPYKEMKIPWFVHAGFLGKWKAIEDQIAAWMNYYFQSGVEFDNIVLVGHSQGGAMAVLFHEWIRFHTLIPVKTITFGAPRLVWAWNFKKIRDRFEGVVQYRDKRDLVPHLPPKLFGYKDVGEIVELGDKFSLIKTISKLVTEWHTEYNKYFFI